MCHFLFSSIAPSSSSFFHLGTGRRWLAQIAIALRTVTVALNFLLSPNLNFTVVAEMRQVRFLGDLVHLPVCETRPLLLVAHLALFALLVFICDASVTAWKVGRRRQAFMGGSIVLWLSLGTIQTVAIHWLHLEIPQSASPYIIASLVIAAFDLSLVSKHAVKLETKLKITQENNRRDLAHLGRVATFSELSVNLAHEMNQPLGIILVNTQAAQRILATEAPDLDEVREILKDIQSENLRASEVIKRMRALLKRGEARLEHVDINELIGGVIQLVRKLLQERQISFTHEAGVDLPLVAADKVQLQQVLINLILNASEAMADENPERRHLKITTSGGSQAVQIAVTDSGRGLPADCDQMFQPYYTTKENGLGMGLAICRAIVEAHHGQIWAEPNPTVGVTLHLALPVAETLS